MSVTGVRAVTMGETRRRVERRLRRAGLDPAAVVLDQLTDYLLLLERWNHRMNLTALDRPDDAVDRLVVEPLLAARHLDADAESLIDLGSGGGSPAIPLKIAVPRLALTMVESKTRKSVFLREVVRHLGLPDVSVETVRYEQLLTRPEFFETFDVASIRAVRVETQDLRTLQAFLRRGGELFWLCSATQPLPLVAPPLEVLAEAPLVEALRSRLVILRKRG